jgi:hypothetical protein
MDESEWVDCVDPDELLSWLGDDLSVRKAILLACGCCRALHWRFSDPRSRATIEAAEEFADGGITLERIRLAASEARAAYREAVLTPGTARRFPRAGEITALTARELLSAFLQSELLPEAIRSAAVQAVAFVRQGVKRVKPAQAALVRDVVRNPFHPAILSPAWRTSVVVSLAQAAYECRELPAGVLDAARVAILADALEDAGCTDAEILGHLRGPGPHVRGCWALDLILGKE